MPTKQNVNTEISEDTKTIVTVLLLIFIFPIGLLLTWFWVKWPSWVKLIISIPVLLVGALISLMLFALVLGRSLPGNVDADYRSSKPDACISLCTYSDEKDQCIQRCKDNNVIPTTEN